MILENQLLIQQSENWNDKLCGSNSLNVKT